MASTRAQTTVSDWCYALRSEIVSLKQGGTLELINSDIASVHHPYIDSPDFSFDAGEQSSGDKADIVFDKPGTFVVLCGIHPKMHLVVTVQNDNPESIQ